MTEKPAERVIAYVDGFNLYFGMRDAGHRRFFWLNVHNLAKRLLGPQQVLHLTKYFTARISGPKPGSPQNVKDRKNAKRKRQTNYLDALATYPQIEQFKGKYNETQVRCRKCGGTWESHEEKMTDVSIATEMLIDAFDDQCDTLILISADSDLVPPVRKIVKMGKRVIAAFPPSRYSADLAKAASGKRMIEKGHLRKSLLPDEVTTKSGYVIQKPPQWTKSGSVAS